QLQLLLLLVPSLSSKTEVSELELLTLEFELILEMWEVGLKCLQVHHEKWLVYLLQLPLPLHSHLKQ
ncbi:hypothetical protein Tco_0288758, partial [Tanacetum coccineum]